MWRRETGGRGADLGLPATRKGLVGPGEVMPSCRLLPSSPPQQDATLARQAFVPITAVSQLFIHLSSTYSRVTSTGHLTAFPTTSLLMETVTNIIQNQRVPGWA